MKAIIKRTSGGIPCKEAKKETLTLTYLDYRTAKTLEEASIKVNWYSGWIASGVNHREDKQRGMVVRDIIQEETLYTIEINDLAGIMNLHEKYGDIVITQSNYLELPTEIEIYDNYRE